MTGWRVADVDHRNVGAHYRRRLPAAALRSAAADQAMAAVRGGAVPIQGELFGAEDWQNGQICPHWSAARLLRLDLGDPRQGMKRARARLPRR